MGVRVRWRARTAATPAGYRLAAAPGEAAFSIERFWLARWAIPGAFATFGACFLTFGGAVTAGAGLGILGGTLHGPRTGGIIMGLGMLGLAVGFAYLAAALFVNRTTIEITAQRIERRDGPLRWRKAVVVDRVAGDGARAESRPGNDVRNLSARWPAPKMFAVVLARADGTETAVLVEQIGLEASARRIADLVDDALRATA